TRPLLESLAESSAVPSDPQEDCHDKVLEELVSALMTSLTPVTTPSSASVSPMALPASYAGDAAVCGGFLLQVDLFIEMQPQKFTTERSKVAFLISLLNGNALDWARAIWNAGGAIIYSYDAFKNHFKEVCGSTMGELSVSDQLLHLRQGSSTTREYTLQFRTLVAGMRWPSSVPTVKVWTLPFVLKWPSTMTTSD
uniref:DUF4939 domain-containing protein n=1 Tax=Sinocyclocheilus anshuiensis TaxID=1608454 RepID=A0A671SCJ9_9TELE